MYKCLTRGENKIAGGQTLTWNLIISSKFHLSNILHLQIATAKIAWENNDRKRCPTIINTASHARLSCTRSVRSFGDAYFVFWCIITTEHHFECLPSLPGKVPLGSTRLCDCMYDQVSSELTIDQRERQKYGMKRIARAIQTNMVTKQCIFYPSTTMSRCIDHSSAEPRCVPAWRYGCLLSSSSLEVKSSETRLSLDFSRNDSCFRVLPNFVHHWITYAFRELSFWLSLWISIKYGHQTPWGALSGHRSSRPCRHWLALIFNTIKLTVKEHVILLMLWESIE